jgi:DNA-binding Xre family transcriptional regulator
MLRNNLAILLAERQLKITRVANDTGISRTTLTALVQNENKMIQNETINKLCRYLNTSPTFFFEFIPMDFSFSFELTEGYYLFESKEKEGHEPDGYNIEGYLNIDAETGTDTIEYSGLLEDLGNDGFRSHIFDIYIEPATDNEKNKINALLINISQGFITDITKIISEKIKEKLQNDNWNFGEHSNLTINLLNKKNK